MEHQKDGGERGAAQPNPAPVAGNSETAPNGNRTGMGHCHTSAQLGSHGGVCHADAGAYETAATRREAQPGAAPVTARSKSISAWLLMAFVRTYIVFLSPFFGGACKFYPSCSNYAYEAIAMHGARRGFVLAAQRLLRCRPFTKGGFDPVPGPEPYVQREDFPRRLSSGEMKALFAAGLKPEPPKEQRL